MSVKCAWCGETVARPDSEPLPEEISHTICPACEVKLHAIEHQTGKKPWRLESYNPLTSDGWRPVWEIEDDQLQAAAELRMELNRINAPVVLRIVPNIEKLANSTPIH